MLAPLLMLQLAQSPVPVPVYSSPALREFVEAAAASNHEPPATLSGYRARVESELSLIVRDTLGRERSAQIEQVALDANWSRGSEYDLRVVGYRSQSVGVPYSALSIARAWTIPYLYGDRLTLGVDFGDLGAARRRRSPADSTRLDSASARKAGDTVHAVHPLAADRDQFYRFRGGDTVAVLRSGQREIPIVRVHVVPVLDSAPRLTRLAAFEGEIDFDATRHQIVRMRGRFLATPPPRRNRLSLSRLPGVVAVAYVELVNAEVNGRYWLPAFQRSEFQASFAPLGAERSVFRVVSRFYDLDVEQRGDSEGTILAGAPAGARGSSDIRPHLTYAPDDSISGYRNWTEALGASTSDVKGSDFDDLAPDEWRASGAPRFELAPTRFGEVFRYNRVEGAYTGLAARERFRDALPGVTAHVYGGWAWSEGTLRGGASAAYAHGATTISGRVERVLASTNDFTPPLEDGADGFGALVGGYDDQDYVDRRLAALGLTSYIGRSQGALLILEAGPGSDRPETTRLDRSPIGGGQFRLNRWSAPGSYLRGAAALELHPDVTGLYLEPGVGAIASYEVAAGSLSWQRAEITLAARRDISDLVISSRAQAGVVWGARLPPQQLFELGGENALPGYGYKQFAGDHAVIMGALAAYTFPVLRRPWRLVRALVVPGVSPGIAAGLQGGWSELSTVASRLATVRLDPATASCSSLSTCPGSPLSMATDRVRATVDARLTFFGGLIGVGVARAIDQAAPWRLAFRFGQTY
jgi:hypothetical protein